MEGIVDVNFAYAIDIKFAGGKWTATSPDVPNLMVIAESLALVLDAIHDRLVEALSYYVERDLELPLSSSHSSLLLVAVSEDAAPKLSNYVKDREARSSRSA